MPRTNRPSPPLRCFQGLLLLLGLSSPVTLAQSSPDDYPWLAELKTPLPPTTPLDQVFPAPEGFDRVSVPDNSFQNWLRTLPVRTDRTHVLSYRGDALSRPSAAILLIDVGDRDLMQCADSILRLHAEYLWADGRADEAAYRFTSGDLTKWVDWTGGERLIIQGNSVVRKPGKPRSANHASYRKWLNLVFTYAGTSSLARDTPKPTAASPVGAGDFYVDPGFPGHAVIVLDVVENDAGDRLGLIGQGFMPAEDIHVVQSKVAVDRVWFPLATGENATINTPSWRAFPSTSRRRFP